MPTSAELASAAAVQLRRLADRLERWAAADGRRDPERWALVVAVLASTVLLGDAVGLHRAAAQACAPTALPPRTALDVSVQLRAPSLRAGHDVRGDAMVTNRTHRRVLVTGAEAVLVTPGTRRPLTWPARVPYGTAELQPGTYATVPFVLHLSSCRRGGSTRFSPGFYEVVVLVVEREAGREHLRSGAPRAVVLSP